MGLKQSIVVVNEYTVKNKSGKGSRGSTPGDYVTRYMARDKATEDLTPVKFEDTDSYIIRYMARKEASETLQSVSEIKQGMRDAQGFGGVAFGYGDVSLSHSKLKAVSKDIQNNFNRGKTVMKTVLSFTEEYLKENGIVDNDFVFQKNGDYRGNIDQMKLRMAIMNGLDKMSRNYDDLQYVGVIQVDTAHVHCHLAMVDRGRGNLAKDGTQKGKISERSKRDLRRGIDMYLDEKQTIKHMSSNITHDKRNALCFIKKYTHETMNQHGTPQFLLSCLPDDKRLWRASTNRKEMKKPNAIVREYVIQVLNQPDSGYREALMHVDDYAKTRQQNEDLSDKEYRQLFYNGQERIIEDCMNGVYAVLKQIPDSEKRVKTPMLDVMSMDYETMASEMNSDPMIEFGFKLRSYSSRLQHHRKEMHKYHDAVEDYNATIDKSEDSKPLCQFFQFEEEYNAKLMCKYQHFLSFLPPGEEYEDDFKDLMDYRKKMESLQQLRDDPSCKRMSPESAEDYGVKVYDMHGGRYAAIAPQILDRRLELMETTYAKKEADFRLKLADYGLTLDEHGISRKKPYEFHDVKALDLHHLSYDFTYDVPISKPNVDEFIHIANERHRLFQNAKDYLNHSGQGDMVSQLPESDINLMKEVADRMTVNPVLVTTKPTGGKKHNSRTVKLDTDYTKTMELAVKVTVQSVQFDK